MDPTKSSGRSKIFTCFKPVSDGDDDDDDRGFDPALLPFSDDETVARRKRRLRRTFNAALKAVFFKASLLKKSRSENVRHDCDRLRGNFISNCKKILHSMKKNIPHKPSDPAGISRTNSDCSSCFSFSSGSRTPSIASSSSASSYSSDSRSNSGHLIRRSVSLDFIEPENRLKRTVRRDPIDRKCAYNSKTALETGVILLVCLLALVWGKVFAVVVCTALWLLFSPTRRRGHRHGRCRQRQLRRFDSFDVSHSEEYYKKRAILEGF